MGLCYTHEAEYLVYSTSIYQVKKALEEVLHSDHLRAKGFEPQIIRNDLFQRKGKKCHYAKLFRDEIPDVQTESNTLFATRTTSCCKWIDDIGISFCEDSPQLGSIRDKIYCKFFSVSRVGYYDFGANKRNIQLIIDGFREKNPYLVIEKV